MVPCPGRPLAGRADPGPVGETPRMTSCHPFGRAEPAPPRGPSGGKRPCGKGPEMAREGVFSEGRTLCVRMARPHECRGIPFSPDDEAKGRLAYWAHASVKPVLSYPGVRSPPLRGVEAPRRDGLAGRGSGIGDFLGGTHSVRSFGPAERMPRHFFPTTCVEDCPGAYRPHVSVKRKPTLRACGARPSAGFVIRAGMALRGNARKYAKVDFLGGTHSVRPFGTAERMPRHFFPTRCVRERPGA